MLPIFKLNQHLASQKSIIIFRFKAKQINFLDFRFLDLDDMLKF